MTATLAFSWIDAKDCDVVRMLDDEPANLHNYSLLSQIKLEYLRGILALQKQLQEKYGDKFIENEPVDGDSKDELKDTFYDMLVCLDREEKDEIRSLYYT